MANLVSLQDLNLRHGTGAVPDRQVFFTQQELEALDGMLTVHIDPPMWRGNIIMVDGERVVAWPSIQRRLDAEKAKIQV